MALQKFDDAAKDAIIIAREEQISGNYRNARSILLKNYLAIKRANMTIPSELDEMLMVAHNYLTVKVSNFFHQLATI